MVEEIVRRIAKPPETFFSPQIDLGIEILSLFIIVILSFIIYKKTKNLYKLSERKGIDYFSKAFLFFGFAFAVRLLETIVRIFGSPDFFHFRSFAAIYIFFSLVAILYLIYSLYVKKGEYEWTIFVIAYLIPIFSREFLIGTGSFLAFQILLFIVALILITRKALERKGKKDTYVLYLILFLFWIMTTVGIRISNWLNVDRVLIGLLSAVVFIYIFYKVSIIFSINKNESKKR